MPAISTGMFYCNKIKNISVAIAGIYENYSIKMTSSKLL
jgi:hypothetical protein